MTDKQKIEMLIKACQGLIRVIDEMAHFHNFADEEEAAYIEAGQAIVQAQESQCLNSLDKKETATEVIIKAENSICPECGEYCPDDEGVKNGMKCGTCAY